MLAFMTNRLLRAARRLTGRLIWTHPNIAQTFRSQPPYVASFKQTWLSLLWGGEASARQLREAIAVSVSVSNQCFY